jgi:hypothetical protein
VVPTGVDPLDALDRAFSRLREIVAEEKPAIRYFSLDLRVTSDTPVPRPQ